MKTLITITGPTCAGKSHLLDELDRLDYFTRIVNTTTREIRPKERESVDYYFISKKDFEKNPDEFIESVFTHNNYYGVTKSEFKKKISGDKIPVIILEPHGIDAFIKIASKENVQLFKIFILTPEEVRIVRLQKRYLQEYNSDNSEMLQEYTTRLLMMLNEEKLWFNTYKWDIILSGVEREKALKLLLDTLKIIHIL